MGETLINCAALGQVFKWNRLLLRVGGQQVFPLNSGPFQLAIFLPQLSFNKFSRYYTQGIPLPTVWS
jgi:hypothetical protein